MIHLVEDGGQRSLGGYLDGNGAGLTHAAVMGAVRDIGDAVEFLFQVCVCACVCVCVCVRACVRVCVGAQLCVPICFIV